MRTPLTAATLLLLACQGDPDPGADAPTGTDGASDTAAPIDTGEPLTNPGPNPLTTGGSERCVMLYGGNDRVRGPDEGLPLGSTARTLQIWVRTRYLGEQIALSHGRPSPHQGFQLGLSRGGTPMVRAGLGEERVEGDVSIADDAWHHLVAAYDGRLVVILVDGEIVATGPLTVDTQEGDLVAGNTPTGDLTAPWVGWLDDARIYYGARPPAEVTADPDGLTIDPTSLLLWWDFEIDGAGPGLTVPDLSDHGHDGITGGGDDTPEFLPCR